MLMEKVNESQINDLFYFQSFQPLKNDFYGIYNGLVINR